MKIRIQSRQEGFRRAGIAHSTTPTDYEPDRFSKEELESLKSEPMLIVSEIEDKPAKALTSEKSPQSKK